MKNIKDLKANSFRKYATFIIACMLSIILIYTNVANAEYAFMHLNDNVIYNGNKSSNKVCLMINVYWGTEYIESILEVLAEYGVKTTFFVGGMWVEKEPEMFKKIYESGHEIGNHGYFHLSHDKMSYEQNLEEISATHAIVKTKIDYDMKLFAPPSGAFNKATIESASELGYLTIMWTRDTIDWRDKNSNLVFKRSTEKTKGGDFILMHPTNHTLKALPLILEYYKLNNLIATTVSECLIGDNA